MNKKVKIGILGCAKVAEKYAIKAFQSISNGELVCIASRDLEKAKEWAKKYGIKHAESYDSLLKREDVDAVYIPLPIGLHEEWVLKAAEQKKHVISEKSLSHNLESVKRIIDACKKNKVVLYENFMCDYHPQHEKVISLIKKGEIGKAFTFEGHFGFPPMEENNFRYKKELGGGSLNDAGAYTVFMARKIFGKEPIAVTCKLVIDEKNEVDMRGSAQIEFDDGQVGLIAFSFDNVYQNNYSVWGQKGLIRVLRAYAIPPDMKPPIEVIKNDAMKETINTLEVLPANHFELIFSDFCETILSNDKSKIEKKYKSILNQARVMEAMRISSGKNRKVLMEEIK